MTKNIDVLAILNTFLMKVGLGRVLFDENNAVALTFDGITIMVQHDDAHQLLRVTSAIAKLQLESDWEVEAKFFSKILELNLKGLIEGRGSVGLDPNNQLLIFSNHMTVTGLEQEEFEKYLERSINTIEDWHQLLKAAALSNVNQIDSKNTSVDDVNILRI